MVDVAWVDTDCAGFVFGSIHLYLFEFDVIIVLMREWPYVRKTNT